MEYVKLGGTSVDISRVGFGCDQLGQHGWGDSDHKVIQHAVNSALDLGVNLFDTADCYGKGISEVYLGEALGNRRDEAVIATKAGVKFDDRGRTFYDNSVTWLDEALDQSLTRLGTDYIDLYQIHYWDERTDFVDIFEYLEKKVQQGKIRAYGVSNIVLSRHITHRPPNLVSFSHEFSLANRTFETQIIEGRENWGLTFFSWGSLGQGILTGKYSEANLPQEPDRRARPAYLNFHGKKLQKNLELVNLMKKVACSHPDRSLSQLAVRALLDRHPSSVVLTGIKSRPQIEDNVGATGWQLSDSEVSELFDPNFLD